MILASRIANAARVAMPYAAWAGYVVQLGYVGYNLYQLYHYYTVQVQLDREAGCNRSVNDTIELVIKTRRRPRIREDSTENEAQTNSNAPTREPQPDPTPSSSTNGTTTTENLYPILSNEESAIANEEKSSAGCSKENEPTQPDHDDVICVYDSRNEASGTSWQPSAPEYDDDALSNVSTLLESTDSNRGIIHDIYSECFICARTLNDSNRPVATLPFCMHPFHQTCLDGILKWHPKCPICNSNIFSPI